MKRICVLPLTSHSPFPLPSPPIHLCPSAVRADGPVQTLYKRPGSTLATLVTTVAIDRGVSFDAARALLESRGDPSERSPDGFYESRRRVAMGGRGGRGGGAQPAIAKAGLDG